MGVKLHSKISISEIRASKTSGKSISENRLQFPEPMTRNVTLEYMSTVMHRFPILDMLTSGILEMRWCRGSGRLTQFPSPGFQSSPCLKMSCKMEQFPSCSFRLGAQEKDRQIFTKRLVYTQFPEGGEMPCCISNSRDFISRIGYRDDHHSS